MKRFEKIEMLKKRIKSGEIEEKNLKIEDQKDPWETWRETKTSENQDNITPQKSPVIPLILTELQDSPGCAATTRLSGGLVKKEKNDIKAVKNQHQNLTDSDRNGAANAAKNTTKKQPAVSQTSNLQIKSKIPPQGLHEKKIKEKCASGPLDDGKNRSEEKIKPLDGLNPPGEIVLKLRQKDKLTNISVKEAMKIFGNDQDSQIVEVNAEKLTKSCDMSPDLKKKDIWKKTFGGQNK